ncbi:hypothetical protein ElyMa_005258600 [Elysia marginata]|uniref:Uncharacterized protein n=1 Tax=Elysia marginata TaxID=1093978 RepID=A0AAV4JYA8_9GAST|nr:hypothetical protein ElyMa_005258600 [Elysia marginata]
MLWVWYAPPIGTPESLADCALGGKLSRWHTLRAEPPRRYQRIAVVVAVTATAAAEILPATPKMLVLVVLVVLVVVVVVLLLA